MNMDKCKGFLAGLLCCVLVFVLMACGGNEAENRLTKKNQTTLEPGVSLTPAATLDETGYRTKLERIAAVLDYYYYQDIDFNKVVDGLYHGAVDGIGDPYTVYFNADEYAAFTESSDGKYAGFGSRVQVGDNGYPLLTQVFPGSPADKAGILTGDYIIEIDGEDVYGLDLDLVAMRMRGEVGTYVEVLVYREGEPDYLTFRVRRDVVEIPTVESKLLDNRIGYVKVSEFDEVTATQFDKEIKSLNSQGMQALIVDLRGNPGGLLKTVQSMLSRILPKGELLVYMEDKNGNREDHYSESPLTLDIPIAVLIDGYSASASEVFAGCLQDYGKAILVGTQSFGKGIVQTMYPLGDGSALKVTISAYYTPKGRNIHKTGLTPDVVVELDASLRKKNSIPVEEDNQIQTAVAEIMKKLGQ